MVLCILIDDGAALKNIPEVIEPAHVAGSPCSIDVTMATISVSHRRRPGHTPCGWAVE